MLFKSQLLAKIVALCFNTFQEKFLRRVIFIPVTYAPLWRKLDERRLTTMQLRISTGIAPNTMTRLRRNEEVSLSILGRICDFLKCDYSDVLSYVPEEAPNYSARLGTFSIKNRRYLGNKYKLLPFISRVVQEYCPDVESVADIFSGTGSVASAFNDRHVITNDILYSNYICNLAWFSGQDFDENKIGELITHYNNINNSNIENYMTRNFADTYFSRADCAKIGIIREDIERQFQSGFLNERERALLIMTLIYAMDKIANTCGHYDAYIRKAVFNRPLVLAFPQASHNNSPENICYNEDANKLVRRISADLFYIDPPYNSRQYCDSYHLLENVARWEQPEVFGVARKPDRRNQKSKYCSKNATEAFADLIANIRAKYILFSYNNMSNKGNDRSNSRMTDEDIFKIMGEKGHLRVFEEHHRAFSAGKSSIKDNVERLFLYVRD